MELENLELKSNILYMKKIEIVKSGGFLTRTGTYRIVMIFHKNRWVYAPIGIEILKGYLPERQHFYFIPPNMPYAVITFERKKAQVNTYSVKYYNFNELIPRIPENYINYFLNKLNYEDNKRGVPEIAKYDNNYVRFIHFNEDNITKILNALYTNNDNVLDNLYWDYVHGWFYLPRLTLAKNRMFISQRGIQIKNFITFSEYSDIEKNKLEKPVKTKELKIEHHIITFDKEIQVNSWIVQDVVDSWEQYENGYASKYHLVEIQAVEPTTIKNIYDSLMQQGKTIDLYLHKGFKLYIVHYPGNLD